jgi:hypothetical protein
MVRFEFAGPLRFAISAVDTYLAAMHIAYVPCLPT